MRGGKVRIWKIVSTVLIAAFVLFAALLLIGRLLGGGFYTVLSGSMEPEYPVGSLIYVKPVDYRELKVGDPITYLIAEDMSVTHRIVEINSDANEPDTLWFTTKGDANSVNDAAPVHYKNIVGKPIFKLPYIGYGVSWVKTPVGMAAVVIFIIILIISAFIPSFKKKKNKTGKKPIKECSR